MRLALRHTVRGRSVVAGLLVMLLTLPVAPSPLAGQGIPADSAIRSIMKTRVDSGNHLLDTTKALKFPAAPVHHVSIALPSAALQRLVGTYAVTPTFTLTVSLDGDALYLAATGQEKLRIWPEAPDRFFLKDVDAEIVFALNGDGPATSVTLIQNGISQSAPRKM
ncbi:MAG: DUF3471 domain-containing protein [Gemmatimonadales bacterium]